MASATPTPTAVGTAEPPLPPDTNRAATYLIPSWILLSIAVALFAVRMRQRFTTVKRFYAEDYPLIFAMLVICFEMPIITLACHYGLGRHTVHVSSANITKALYYLYMTIFPFYLGTAAARVSIALMLMRLNRDNRGWNIVLWAVIVVQVGQGILSTVVQLVQCRPIHALWGILEMEASEYKCISPLWTQVWGWSASGCYILTDITLTLLPLTLILRLRRSVYEKTLMATLMSLCLLASAASITKVVFIAKYTYRTPDVLYNFTDLSLWNRMEELLIAIAASAPTMKRPAERAYRTVIGWTRGKARQGSLDRHRGAGSATAKEGDEESAGVQTKKESLGIPDTETGSKLKPRWWFLPNAFVHTDLVTTLNLNQEVNSSGSREIAGATDLSSQERTTTSLGLSSLGTRMGSLASSAGSSSWYRSSKR